MVGNTFREVWAQHVTAFFSHARGLATEDALARANARAPLCVPKAEFPTALVCAPALEPSLRLITCGDSVDADMGSYLGDVIVYADPPRSRRRARCATVLVLLAVLQLPAVTGSWAAEPRVEVVAQATVDGRSRLVVGPAGAAVSPGSFSVTVEGKPQSVSAESVLSDRLAMTVVVDASAGAASVLQPGMSGVMAFALGTSPATRVALVADATPPTVGSPLQAGRSAVLRGLTGVAPHGGRQTSAALDLALRQLPREADNPRLVVLYTAAPDVAGRASDDIVAQLTSAGVVLAVVTTAGDAAPVPPYWSAVTTGTGGVAVAARSSDVVDAFTRLATALSGRYLLTLPAPGRLPAPAVVGVATPNAAFTAVTVLPEEASPAASASTRTSTVVVLAAVVIGVLVLLLGIAAIARNRKWARVDAVAEAPPETSPAAIALVQHCVWNIPDRYEPVVIRERLLAKIGKTLRAGGRAVVQPVDGRAGLGTTTAMIEFAHRHRDAYDIAWWIMAQYSQSVGDQLAQLAEALGLAAPTDSAEQATAALLDALHRRDRWLLIFDQTESLHDLAEFLPARHGHVLVGSADPGWTEYATAVTVPPFTRAESVELLQARRGQLTADEADRVAAVADDLPLAIDLTGAMLADTGMSVDTYLRLVAEQGADASSAACSVAFDRLAADDPQALALLTLVAWLGPQPVPLSLLTEHAAYLPAVLAGAARDRSQLAERAATLGRRALAMVDSESVELHRLPAHQLVGRTVDECPDDASWATWAMRLLRAAVPPDPADPASWARWGELMPHVRVGRQIPRS